MLWWILIALFGATWNNQMDAILLARGKESSQREVGLEIPSPLLLCGDKPFLEVLFEQIYTYQGIERVILAVCDKAEQIVAYFEKHPPKIPILYSFETASLGTGGALKKAASLSKSEKLLVMNGDSVLHLSWLHFVSSHHEKEADLTIACSHVENASPYGKILIDPATCRLTKFQKQGTKKESGWVNGGVYLFNKKMVELFPTDPCSLEREAIPSILDKQVYGFPCDGLFISQK